MIRRTTKIAVEVAAGLIGVAVLLVALASWRLSAGPVNLDFLTPRMEAALADPASGVAVRIGATQIVWGGWSRTIDVHTRDVAVRNRDGAVIAVFPDIVISFSLRALVQGTLAPSVVEVFGARIRVVRNTDGRFEFGQRPDSGAESDLSRLLPAVVAQLDSQPAAERPLSFLNVLRILDGHIFVEDRKANLSWEAPGAVIELRRGAAGVTGEVGMAIGIRGTRATMVSDFTYDKASGRLDFGIDADNLHPAALAWLAPQLEVLSGLTTPLNASATASVRSDGTIDTVHFDLSGGPGQLTLVDWFAEPLPIAQVRLLGDFDRPAGRLTLETGELRFGSLEAPGPVLSIAGSVASAAETPAGDLDMEATVTASDLPLAELGRYWPRGVAVNERAWVVGNITQGLARQATMQVALRLPGGALEAAEIARVDGTLDYHDLEIHYMRPLPPVVAVSGEATFDRQGMAFRAQGGRLGSLTVEPTTVDIGGLDAEQQIMSIDLAVAGPLRAALELLDHDRLALIRRLDIDPAAVNGLAAARVGFRFPLIEALKLDDITINATANLEQTSIDAFMLGQDVREGSMSLVLDKAGMVISGPVQLGGVGVELHWKEAFTDAAPYSTDLAAQIPQLDESARKRFGVDLAPYLEGPVSASVRMLTDHAGTNTLSTAVNLQSATLAVPPLAWRKAPGEPGEAYIALTLADDRMAEVSQFGIDAGTLRVQGSGRFADAGRALVSLTLDELAIDETNVHKVDIARQGEGFDIRIGGGIVDATPLFKGNGDDASEAEGKEAKTVPPATTEERTFTPLLLSANNLDRLIFGPERYLAAVDLDFARGRRGWERLTLTGEVPPPLWSKAKPSPAPEDAPAALPEPPRGLRIDFGTDAAGPYKLFAATQDMGGVLRALDVVDTIHGGQLEIAGTSEGPLPTEPLAARIDARDYVVVNASLLTRLLTVASLTGIVDLLKGEGITFTHLIGDVTFDDGTLKTDLMRAYGPALGLTAKGQLDFDESVADLQGTVVPAYTVNRILGEIPLLGPLLTGGEGEGFLAVVYRMSGPLAEPEVSVNPLSALAPGFLRGLFGVFDGSKAASSEDQPRALPERLND